MSKTQLSAQTAGGDGEGGMLTMDQREAVDQSRLTTEDLAA